MRRRARRWARRTGTQRRMGCAAWTRRSRRPGDPKLLSDVDEIVFAHLARETTAQDEGGSKKGKRKEGSGEQAEAVPRAFLGQKVI